MADTERTLSALLTQHFPDNSVGAIKAQDLRDFVVSVLGGYGGIAVVDGAVAQLLGTTPNKLTGFVADLPASGAEPDHTNDQVTVKTAGRYWVEFSASVGGDVATYTARLAKNGTAEGTLVAAVTTTAGEVESLHFAGPVDLIADDVLTVAATANSSGKNLTLIHAQLSAKRIG